MMVKNCAQTLILADWAKFSMLGVIYLLIPAICLGQSSQIIALKIGSIENRLSSLRDSLNVDGLNELGRLFIETDRRDSAVYYTGIAFSKAQQLQYVHGIAVSLLHKSRIAKHFDDDFILSEKLAEESLGWFEKTSNKEGLYGAYYDLEYSALGQSRYDEALGYLQKMYGLAKDMKDLQLMQAVTFTLGSVYRSAGNYEKCFEYCRIDQQMALKSNNKIEISSSLFGFGELYMQLEDYPTALTYYQQAFQMDDPDITNNRIANDWDIWAKMEFAEIFSHLGMFDSAWHYYELYRPAQKNDKYYRVYLVKHRRVLPSPKKI